GGPLTGPVGSASRCAITRRRDEAERARHESI
ncbi:MAG: hypothetical protein AVDCRST_MAG93-196, partial [uncultured Chloroflexia bacterium]